jgi:oxygen-independent coproporphyrinogen-3 oxidase
MIERPRWLWPAAAYVHVPFCAHHCGYCDFAVAVGQEHERDRYVDALACELERLGGPQPVRTLFLGGGTPSHLSAQQLTRLFEHLLHWLPLQPGHEFSIEANPNSLDADKVRVLADHGVNRVSLGAQSFDPDLLRVLERDHAPADVPRAVEMLHRRIDNVSLDLIFGVPGQTTAQWEADLRQTLALKPSHVATYGLTFERGTRLWKQQQHGQVRQLAEDAELEMYNRGIDVLESAGFEHYELSNFARPGFRCRHNETYWANHAYFGFGMGAAQYVEGTRTLNVRNLAGYLKRALARQPTHFQTETLPPLERALETASLQLRRGDGIARLPFREQTGFDLDELLGTTLNEHADAGLLADDGACVKLTRRGKSVADAVIATLWKVFCRERARIDSAPPRPV